MKNRKSIIATLAASLLTLALLGGCNTAAQSASSASDTSDAGTSGASSAAGESVAVRKITIAASPGYKPITYTDEDGKLHGYDIAVFEKIDELLPEYEFVFESVDKETLNIGVETGKYQVGINGLFWSAERAEKYIIPENQLGATRVGFIVREDETRVSTWDDLVNVKVAPTGGSGGIYAQLMQYNEQHPDAPIVFEVVTTASNAIIFGSIRDNTYDATPGLIDTFNQITDEDLISGLKITDTASKVPTFAIVNKAEVELAEKINETLGALRADGTLSKLAIEHYGADVFAE